MSPAFVTDPPPTTNTVGFALPATTGIVGQRDVRIDPGVIDVEVDRALADHALAFGARVDRRDIVSVTEAPASIAPFHRTWLPIMYIVPEDAVLDAETASQRGGKDLDVLVAVEVGLHAVADVGQRDRIGDCPPGVNDPVTVFVALITVASVERTQPAAR
jgi:hypothetical protein